METTTLSSADMLNTTDRNEDVVVSSTERTIEAVVLSIICAVAIVGNVCLTTIIIRDKKLRTPSNLLIVGLSCADMLVAMVNMPVTIATLASGKWTFSDSTCQVMGFVTMITLCASVMHLAVISFNRYILICHNHRFMSIYTFRNVIIMVAGVWFFCALISLPPLVGWSAYKYLPNTFLCFCDWSDDIAYTFFMCIVCFFGPFTSMSFSYYKILRYVRKSNDRLSTGYNNDQTNHQTSPSPSSQNDRYHDVFSTSPGTPQHSTETSIGDSDVTSEQIKPIQTPSGISLDVGFGTDDGRSSVYSETLDKSRREKNLKRRQEDIKLTMTFIVVIMAFVISWLPYCVMMFWTVFATDSVPRIPDMITLLLGFANSCYNPFIYGVLNKRFHSGYRRLFCTCLSCGNRCELFGKKTKDGDISQPTSSSSGIPKTPKSSVRRAIRRKLTKR